MATFNFDAYSNLSSENNIRVEVTRKRFVTVRYTFPYAHTFDRLQLFRLHLPDDFRDLVIDVHLEGQIVVRGGVMRIERGIPLPG